MSAVLAADHDLQTAVATARRRLIPFLFLLYIANYLDRVNVGFASLHMNRALGFSSTTYGLGAGMFFLSYALLEVPSNVILARIGARLWIARIMISWGVVSSAMMFVRSAETFYALRFLLGMAEAGFFPGMIFYLTRWFPARERARTIAAFMTAVLIAGVVGGPISGALLGLDGAAGLAGWQWLFLLEGIPSIVLGLVVLRVLIDSPTDAPWLTAPQRQALAARLAAESRDGAGHDLRQALQDGRTWLLAAVYFTIPLTSYGISFWMPQMVKTASGAGDFTVGLLTAIPYAVGAAGMVAAGRHSDRSGERRWHVAVAALVSAAGLVLSVQGAGTGWIVGCLSIATLGYASMFGPFWALATGQGTAAGGVAAAAAIALVNSVGNTGGFVGPFLLGYISDVTRRFDAGLYAIAATLAAGAALVLLVREN